MLCGLRRDINVEFGAFVRSAACRDKPAVVVDDFLYNGQSHPCAIDLLIIIKALENFKNALSISGFKSDPVVFYSYMMVFFGTGKIYQ